MPHIFDNIELPLLPSLREAANVTSFRALTETWSDHIVGDFPLVPHVVMGVAWNSVDGVGFGQSYDIECRMGKDAGEE